MLFSGIGELSSATDFPAIVKHDGVAGEAVALMPFGAVRVTPITAVTFNFGAVSVRPDVRVQVLNPTNIGSGTLSLGNGYFIGQPLRLYMLTGGGGGTLTGLALTGGTTSLSSNQILDLVWNGSSWTLENSFFMGGNGFLALSVLGAGPAAGDGSLAIGSGAATAAAAKNATAVGPVQAFTPNEVAIGVGSYARKRYNSLSTVTTSATPKEATTDRNTAASTNRINFSTSAGMYRVKATISAKDGAGANMLQFVREVVVLSTGSAATLVNTVTSSGDVNSGITGSPAAVLGVTGNQLTLTVTGSTQTLTWSALVDVIEMVAV
jgi:hypothetical protein